MRQLDGHGSNGHRLDERRVEWTRALLAGHVSLALLMDLAPPLGPPSSELLLHEDQPMAGWRQECPPSTRC